MYISTHFNDGIPGSVGPTFCARYPDVAGPLFVPGIIQLLLALLVFLLLLEELSPPGGVEALLVSKVRSELLYIRVRVLLVNMS